MRKILITSKKDFPKKFSKVNKTNEPWAVISIEGTDDLVRSGVLENNDHYLFSGPNVLNLEFDDIEKVTEFEKDGIKYTALPITPDQAKEILKFGYEHKEYNLLIHCLAGKSRSVAVGLGLMDIFPGVWELSEESNPILTPNSQVLRVLHNVSLETLICE